jgi:hypothetical protein
MNRRIILFRGEGRDDWMAELKLGLWLAGCVGCVFVEASLIAKVMG